MLRAQLGVGQLSRCAPFALRLRRLSGGLGNIASQKFQAYTVGGFQTVRLQTVAGGGKM